MNQTMRSLIVTTKMMKMTRKLMMELLHQLLLWYKEKMMNFLFDMYHFHKFYNENETHLLITVIIYIICLSECFVWDI